MKVEIRHIKDIKDINKPKGQLVEIIEIDVRGGPDDLSDLSHLQAEVGATLIQCGLKIFKEQAQSVTDMSLFGGHIRNKQTGECLIAV